MTYEEWLAIEEVSYSDMSTSVMNVFIGEFDLADYVEALTDAKGKMLNATRAVNGKFSFDPDDVIGAGVIAYLDSLIARGDEYSDALTSFKASAISYCKSVTYPNADKSEADFIELMGVEQEILEIGEVSTDQIKCTLSIASSPLKSCTIMVQQDFGDGWEDCFNISNVKTEKIKYNIQVPTTTAESRRLRIVSPFSVGMSIN